MWAANCMRDYGTTNNTPAHQAPPVWRAPEGLEDLTAAQVGDGGACQHTNDKPDRSGAPRGLRGLAGHHTDTPTDWRPPRGLRGLAAVPVGGGRAWPGFETTRRAQLAARTASGLAATHRHTQRPGPTKQATRRQGLAGLREDTPSEARGADSERAGRRIAGVEDTGGPGRGAGGRRQGLAGLRDDTPSAARGPDGERAGRRPPAPTRRHKHSATNT